jgi:hypothetical protein
MSTETGADCADALLFECWRDGSTVVEGLIAEGTVVDAILAAAEAVDAGDLTLVGDISGDVFS